MRATTCDGTGVLIPEDTPTTGAFGAQYCDDARVIAEKYLSDVHALHTECAEMFQAKLDALRQEARKELQILPDEPQ